MARSIRNLPIDSQPKGLANFTVTVVEMLHNVVIGNMGAKGKNYSAYVSVIFIYILVSNISGLFGLVAPTSNYSVTLSFALISWLLIQRAKIKSNGFINFIKGFFEPIFPFVVPNFFGWLAPLLSMSLRLFGNITSGIVIMELLYQFTGWLSSFIPVIGSFNIVTLIIAPVLHIYFDLFAGFLQAFIFISLTTILTSVELGD